MQSYADQSRGKGSTIVFVPTMGYLHTGEKDAAKIIAAASDLIKSHPETSIDYIAVCNPETLDEVQTIEQPALMALAVKVGTTRLIDNMILKT